MVLNFLSRSRVFKSNGERYRPGWCAKDILAHCALCRRGSEYRIVCASTAMIGWIPSGEMIYILKRSCKHLWHLGRKSSQVWSECNFNHYRFVTELFAKRVSNIDLTQKRQWRSNQLAEPKPLYIQQLLPHLLVEWDERKLNSPSEDSGMAAVHSLGYVSGGSSTFRWHTHNSQGSPPTDTLLK